MSKHTAEVIETYHAWQDAFNTRDIDAMLSRMHFPHLRLADGVFHTWETAQDFRAGQDAMTTRLAEEGWHESKPDSVEAVHSSDDKVHLAIRMVRRRADGSAYNSFDTLWIFTKIDERWGVQFRSSYLTKAVHGLGASLLSEDGDGNANQ